MLVRRGGVHVLGVGLLLLACGGDGGGTAPLGPPARLVMSGGDQQSWYFNNALPRPYSVTVRDANSRELPGVSVDWSIVAGGGSLSSAHSTTDSNGVASTIHTLGPAAAYSVTAIATRLPSVTFTASAAAPPPTVGINVYYNYFAPWDTVVQTGGTVTWTWRSGLRQHNVTYSTGPRAVARQLGHSGRRGHLQHDVRHRRPLHLRLHHPPWNAWRGHGRTLKTAALPEIRFPT